MSTKQAALVQIVVALIFAAAMLASKSLFGANANLARNLLIAAWWVPFSYLCIKAGGSGRSCGGKNNCRKSV